LDEPQQQKNVRDEPWQKEKPVISSEKINSNEFSFRKISSIDYANQRDCVNGFLETYSNHEKWQYISQSYPPSYKFEFDGLEFSTTNSFLDHFVGYMKGVVFVKYPYSYVIMDRNIDRVKGFSNCLLAIKQALNKEELLLAYIFCYLKNISLLYRSRKWNFKPRS